jgi:type IV pilus assembly protein PilW
MKQGRGFTLIELMIAILLGMIVAAIALTVYVRYLSDTRENVELMNLNQEMRAIMDVMVRDIRRSGFVTDDPENNFPCLQQNAFNNVNLFAAGTANAGNTCIVYAYNVDNDISVDCDVLPWNAIEDTDRFGFRVINGQIEMKTSGGNEASCATGTWQDLSEDGVTYNLSYTLTESELDITEMFTDADKVCNAGEDCNICDAGNQCLTVRQVSISLTGTLADGTTQTISEQVRIRNDKYEASH